MAITEHCGFWRSKIALYEDVVIKTCYMHLVPMKLKKSLLTNKYLLETRHNSIFIKIIDVNDYDINPEILYPIQYLLSLKSIETDITKSSFSHDIIFNVYNYLLFLEKHNIEFKYENIVVLANIPQLDNAYWNGSYLSFGAGHQHNPLTSSMIVGHELTHALIQQINDLEYSGHSGALNESFADIFGVVFELFVYETHKSLGWELGSETGFLLRDMKDPHRKWQPKVMYDAYYHDPNNLEDNGGVHINSGIPNHIFVCVSESIGIKSAFQLFYRTLNKLHKFCDFQTFKSTISLVNSYHKFISQETLHNILNEHIF